MWTPGVDMPPKKRAKFLFTPSDTTASENMGTSQDTDRAPPDAETMRSTQRPRAHWNPGTRAEASAVVAAATGRDIGGTLGHVAESPTEEATNVTGTPSYVIASRTTAVCAAAQAPWLPVNKTRNPRIVGARATAVDIAATAPWLSVDKNLYSRPQDSCSPGRADTQPNQAARGSQDDYQEEPSTMEGPFDNTADAMAARVYRELADDYERRGSALERWLLHRFDQRNVTEDGLEAAEPPPPVHCEIIFAHLHREEERANHLRLCLETIYAAVETDHRFATLVAAQFQLHKLASLFDNLRSELAVKAEQWATRDPDASAWLFVLVRALDNHLGSIWSKIEEVKTLEQQVRLNAQSRWWIVLEE